MCLLSCLIADKHQIQQQKITGQTVDALFTCFLSDYIAVIASDKPLLWLQKCNEMHHSFNSCAESSRCMSASMHEHSVNN